MRRWLVGVSSEGHAVMSMKVRPEPKNLGFEAREAPWRESKTAEPSDNRRGRSPTTRLRSRNVIRARSRRRELRATCRTMPRKHSLIVVAHRVTEAQRIVANQSSPSNGGGHNLAPAVLVDELRPGSLQPAAWSQVIGACRALWFSFSSARRMVATLSADAAASPPRSNE